ncbi:MULTISPECIES: hypothetical protein [Oenococcus]|uniref:Uncharacterized protein n=1 Tax=Oenococcus kitaharae DSM 17330 TaxID=1045004 RepID=G9WF82_9LACO|nr:hypothetical protein [Oenococcus kitaharae]EHN58802.1 hypothetical protein OKIT_0691 [Oenococcus kitaharae DSM 17330]OEY81858.1 hypothetical protein NT96_08875 [Oenococcus kitaharae]OEY84087.1 hypothetical protein NT95_02935 [Oenococcus kitaharae]OEY85553.1 hypothetical protein NV75_03500 [Oenococcus kitaharae]
MKKSSYITLLLSTLGFLFLGLGMSMSLLPTWHLFQTGIVLGIIGLIILFITWLVYRRMTNKPRLNLNKRTIGISCLTFLGVMVFGLGMNLTMVYHQEILGIVIGTIGIFLLLALIPVTVGLKK